MYDSATDWLLIAATADGSNPVFIRFNSTDNDAVVVSTAPQLSGSVAVSADRKLVATQNPDEASKVLIWDMAKGGNFPIDLAIASGDFRFHVIAAVFDPNVPGLLWAVNDQDGIEIWTVDVTDQASATLTNETVESFTTMFTDEFGDARVAPQNAPDLDLPVKTIYHETSDGVTWAFTSEYEAGGASFSVRAYSFTNGDADWTAIGIPAVVDGEFLLTTGGLVKAYPPLS